MPRLGHMLFSVTVLVGLASIVQAEPTEADHARVNKHLVENTVLPAHERFFQVSERLVQDTKKFCDAVPQRDLGPVRSSFETVMAGWMVLEPIRFGPIEKDLRGFRIHYWPDKRGRGGKQLKTMIKAADSAALAPEALKANSVAVQGLPAMEYLLFDPEQSRELAAGSPGDFRCGLLMAIAGNLAGISAELLDEWRALLLAMDSPEGLKNAGFENKRAFTREVIKSMYAALQVMVELKLDPVLGANPGKARPGRVESLLSGRSVQNLFNNLEMLNALYAGKGENPGLRALLSAEQAKLAGDISDEFKQTFQSLTSLDKPLDQIVAERDGWSAVARLAGHVETLKDIIGGKLAPAIGVDLGFNAMDGD